MIIAFTGAQSTGKTTLINELKKFSTLTDKFTFKESFVRKLKKEHSEQDSDGDELQREVIETHLKNLQDDNVILDRCLLDSIVYAIYFASKGYISQETLKYALKTLDTYKDKYDIIFYLRPEFGVVEDGERSPSPEFQNEIAEIFDMMITHMPYVVELRGAVKERVSKIIDTLKERGIQC